MEKSVQGKARGSRRPSHAPKGANVNARVMMAREEFVVRRFGRAALERFRSAASPSLKVALRDASVDGRWTPVSALIEATVLIDRLFGAGDLALAPEMGKFASESIDGVWRGLFFSVVSPQVMVEISAALWRFHFDNGRLVITPVGANAMTMSLVEFATPHRAICGSVGGWVQANLARRCGASVRLRERECRTQGAPRCTWDVGWDKPR